MSQTQPGQQQQQHDALQPSSLQALASNATLASLPPDQLLEDLPSHMLARLLREAASQREELQRRLADSERRVQEFEELQKRRYVVDPFTVTDRVGEAMTDFAEEVVEKWRPHVSSRDPDPWVCADLHTSQHVVVQHVVVYDRQNKTFKRMLRAEAEALEPPPDELPWALSDVISSALLLYRLHCLFHSPQIIFGDPRAVPLLEVGYSDGYKGVWEAKVVHRATGKVLTFSDFKGCACVGYWADEPSQFSDDAIELLNLLCHPQCPHPYDGTVAGTMA